LAGAFLAAGCSSASTNAPQSDDEDVVSADPLAMPKPMLSFTRQTRHYKVTLNLSDIRFTYTEGDVVGMNNVSGVDLISVLK